MKFQRGDEVKWNPDTVDVGTYAEDDELLKICKRGVVTYTVEIDSDPPFQMVNVLWSDRTTDYLGGNCFVKV